MWRFLLLLIMIFPCTLLFPQAGSLRYVCVQAETVKESASFFAGNAGSLSLGDVVMLIRDEGKWAQVQAETLGGWVLSSSLSLRRILPSSVAVPANERALAGKGFSPDIEIEYRENGLDYSVVDSMEGIIIGPEELLVFIIEGGLAGGQ